MATYDGYEGYYSESGFRAFVGRMSHRFPPVRMAVAMFYALKDPKTPVWAKVVITAVLGYVVCPVDLIPDAIPVVGLSDDAAAVAAAYGVVSSIIHERHWQKADKLLGK